MLPTQFTPQNNIPPPSSLQSVLQMDPNQHLQLQQQQEQQQQQPALPTQNSVKRRRKGDGNGDDAPSPSEPRRLRRSHEACARCRSKKIKASPVGRHRRQFPSMLHISHFLSSISAIPNIPNAQLVQRLALPVIKRTGIVRHLLQEVTPSTLKISSLNVKFLLRNEFQALLWRIFLTSSVRKVSMPPPLCQAIRVQPSRWMV